MTPSSLSHEVMTLSRGSILIVVGRVAAPVVAVGLGGEHRMERSPPIITRAEGEGA